MLEFEWVWAFFLLPLPVAALFLFKRASTDHQGALFSPFFSEWQQMTLSSTSKHWLSLIDVLKLMIWICLITALAKPVYVGEPIRIPAKGRELLLAVDVSGSMKESDISLQGYRTNRLEVVKYVLGDFIERREGDRLGLILFGERAYLQCPLTFDRKTVNQFLQESEIGIAGVKATAIGDAIGLAVKRFKDKEVSNRVLVLLTDGQSNMGVDPIEAARIAAEKKITIYTIGIGANSMQVDSGFFGTRMVNPSRDLDEKTLKKIAEKTGGQYFRGRDSKEISDIYSMLDRLEPVEADEQVFRPTQQLFYYPLSAALLLLVLRFFFLFALQLSRSSSEAKL